MVKIIPVENIESTLNKVTEITELATNEQYPSAKAVYDALQNVEGGGTIDEETLVGKKTAEGGEIFNTEYSNTAGGKCFSILSIDKSSGNYVLDSVDGIEIGDIYSIKIGANYDFAGEVYDVLDNNTIHVSNTIIGTTTDLTGAIIWFPYKPDIGTKVNGGAEHAEGYETTALNWASHSEGCNTLAEGRYSHAQNYNTIAGYACHAEGQNTKALGEWSHAQGMATSALNRYTFSFGNSTVSMENYFNGKVLTSLTNEEIEGAWKKANPRFTCANGSASTAGGNNTLALGSVSTALGKETIAKGNNSLSTGYLTSAEGENSASFGKNTHAIGEQSVAFGDYNTAYGKNSITFGYKNNNITEWNLYTPTHTEGEIYLYDDSPNNCIDNLQIEGSNNIIKKSLSYPLYGETIIKNSHIEGKDNKFDIRFNSEMLGSHIEGINNTVDGMKLNSSHVEGLNNNISYKYSNGSGTFEASHIEGYNNKIKTSVIQSHIEGNQNTIESANLGQQVCVHVEGYNNKISNSNYSHTQGTANTVTNSPSGHVGGWGNTISGDSSFAHGHKLQANEVCQFVIGRYNDYKKFEGATNPEEKVLFVIGNGDDAARSNAFEVYHDGHAEIQKMGSTDESVATKQYVDNGIAAFADYIVEQGEDIRPSEHYGWTWRKWKSGIVELWGSCDVTTTFTKKIAEGHWEGEDFPALEYPFTLSSENGGINVQFSIYYTGAKSHISHCVWYGGGNTTTPTYTPYSATQITDEEQVTGRYYVKAKVVEPQ